MKFVSPSLWQVMLLAAVIAITPLAIDMYLPALPLLGVMPQILVFGNAKEVIRLPAMWQ